MKHAAAQLTVAENVLPVRTQGRMRSLLFGLGDCLFLAFVGAATTVLMHGMHEVALSFLVACLAGMVVAMFAQMLLAFAVAPLLGSIESMVPSMVLAMISPMSVCAAHLLGCELGLTACLVLGAALGAAASLLIHVYGLQCRRSFCRASHARWAV
ncbi:MAG: hypothetical protein AB1716_18465 [Planctomycetota bacterium]